MRIYITSSYSVSLDITEIKSIAEWVREDLYEMPRPADYSVADIVNRAGTIVSTYVINVMEQKQKEEFSLADLDDKQRTELSYWRVIKKVLEQIEVIAK